MPTQRTPHRKSPRKPAFRFTQAQQDEFLSHVRAGMRRGAAVDAVFGSDEPDRRRKVRDYIEEHTAFEQRVLDAEVDATEHVEEALYQAAVSGNVAAAVKWLEMRGAQFAEHRGRPRNPEEQQPGGAFDDLGAGVVSLDSRRRT